jgi:hypothetical protein
MVCRNMHQAHLQEVGLMQFPANHVKGEDLRQLVWPLDESRRPSQYHGPGPWLMCEVALQYIHLQEP